MIVNTEEFIRRYASKSFGSGAYIPIHIYNKLLSGPSAFAELPDDVISQMESDKTNLEARDREYAVICQCWHNGLNYEIEGEIADAANEYKTGLQLAESSFFDMSHIGYVCKDRLFNIKSQLQPICHE